MPSNPPARLTWIPRVVRLTVLGLVIAASTVLHTSVLLFAAC